MYINKYIYILILFHLLYEFTVLCLAGGVTGAVSRITGTLGKTLATLTLDDEYQKKRREALYRPPSGITEGFVRGGTSLVTVRRQYRQKNYPVVSSIC